MIQFIHHVTDSLRRFAHHDDARHLLARQIYQRAAVKQSEYAQYNAPTYLRRHLPRPVK